MGAVSAGDTGFVLASAALVLFMTPGLALFYGGMVRSKNVLSTIMQSFAIIGIGSVIWALVGYSLAFGPDVGHFIGNLSWIGLNGVGLEPNPNYAPTIPHLAFMIFQGMFAVITPALITGAFAERMKFTSFLVFVVAWSLLVYSPVAHWVWGVGGWLREAGTLDFAGGTVVHINSAAAALAATLILGARRDLGKDSFSPHNLPLTVAGAGILWFGWFGFNAGSALSAGSLATNAFVVTHLAGAAGATAWILVEWLHRGRPTTLGAASGAVAGLATITPASGFVTPMAALIIGLCAGAICYGGVLVKWKLGYDDSLDVVGIHGVGGIIGVIAVGLFATVAVNAAGANGLFRGNAGQLGPQVLGVVATIAYSFVISMVLFKVVDLIWGLRVSAEDEDVGLDLSQHSEVGYAL